MCTFYLFRCEQKVLLTSEAASHGFYTVPDPAIHVDYAIPNRAFQAVFRILNVHTGPDSRTRKSEYWMRMVNLITNPDLTRPFLWKSGNGSGMPSNGGIRRTRNTAFNF